jgi:hypothetical protein
MARSPVISLLRALAMATGCTTRYSQSLAGSLPRSTGREVESHDTGFSVLGIAVREPTPAHTQVTQLLASCSELRLVEVYYRETVFLILGSPRVTVTATCVP